MPDDAEPLTSSIRANATKGTTARHCTVRRDIHRAIVARGTTLRISTFVKIGFEIVDTGTMLSRSPIEAMTFRATRGTTLRRLHHEAQLQVGVSRGTHLEEEVLLVSAEAMSRMTMYLLRDITRSRGADEPKLRRTVICSL